MTYPKQSTGPDPRPAQGTAPASRRVPANPSFPALEERVLAFWKADDTFRASVAKNPAGENGSNEFVFYDGPPFANGLPHYGHLLTGYVKDIVPRFQTMRGRRVERRFGWDCHGLPAELETMSQLGLKTVADIEEMGIEAFNAACRESVLKYTEEWQAYVTRQARWVDFENDYKTLDVTFMESVLWAFKSLYDKGWVYQGLRVLPYCWNDETPLSNHELRMDDEVYQDRSDPAVTVGLRLETGELALIWTTTPWTLPSNLAIMVRPDIDYVVVQSDVTGTAERYVIAAARVPAYARDLFGDPAKSGDGSDWESHVVERLTGADLIGRHYTPPFSYYLGHQNAHRVVAADFVTTEDGTGLVHSAGGFGEEDMQVTDREGIEAVLPVGPDGRFTAPVDEYSGMLVFDANPQIIDDLKSRTRGGDGHSVTEGTVLLRQESYVHSYPHCWRCKNPLIYKAVSSWFVEVTAFRDRMVELNQQITWVPEHVKDGQFGKWLSNARDWSISRNRYFGSPIPIWQSDDPTYPRTDVYGSIAELEADFGVPVTDLHRPYIDELTRPNPDDPTGRSTMRRVTDILDVWFDSGSMPYAQVHYPFENADWFEYHYPGDFIVEYIGQTRGWFYTMHILATALFDRPAFSSCISHGIVLGSDGQKMSKSLRNYPDVSEVFDRDGADAMRWFLMSSPILRGGNLIVTEQGIREGVRQVMIPLWNAYYFFTLYANAANGGNGYDAKLASCVDRCAGPLHPGEAGRVHDHGRRRAGGAERGGRLRRDPVVPRGAVELVHPALPGPLLGRRFRLVPDGVRHAVHRARADHPGGGPAAAADHRGDLARADRRPFGPPDRVAGGGGGERRGAGARDGPGARGVLDRIRTAQGVRAPGPAAAVVADRGGRRRGDRGTAGGSDHRRAEREVAGADRSRRRPTRVRSASSRP